MCGHHEGHLHLELGSDKVHSGAEGLGVAQGVGRGVWGPGAPAALALLVPHGHKGLHHALAGAHLLQLVPHQLRTCTFLLKNCSTCRENTMNASDSKPSKAAHIAWAVFLATAWAHWCDLTAAWQ